MNNFNAEVEPDSNYFHQSTPNFNSSDCKLIDVNAQENNNSYSAISAVGASSQQSGSSEIRSSPEEEYFSLSCLALKVKLIEQ